MKKLIILLIMIIVITGCKKDAQNLKEKIKKDFVKIMEVSNPASSNPYDYIDNKYYEDIISYGNDAVDVLESLYNSKELNSLESYIAGLAIQEITNCNLNEEYNLDWSTGEEFFELWKDNNCS